MGAWAVCSKRMRVKAATRVPEVTGVFEDILSQPWTAVCWAHAACLQLHGTWKAKQAQHTLEGDWPTRYEELLTPDRCVTLV